MRREDTIETNRSSRPRRDDDENRPPRPSVRRQYTDTPFASARGREGGAEAMKSSTISNQRARVTPERTSKNLVGRGRTLTETDVNILQQILEHAQEKVAPHALRQDLSDAARC